MRAINEENVYEIDNISQMKKADFIQTLDFPCLQKLVLNCAFHL
jgi:hypothetical protein